MTEQAPVFTPEQAARLSISVEAVRTLIAAYGEQSHSEECGFDHCSACVIQAFTEALGQGERVHLAPHTFLLVVDDDDRTEVPTSPWTANLLHLNGEQAIETPGIGATFSQAFADLDTSSIDPDVTARAAASR